MEPLCKGHIGTNSLEVMVLGQDKYPEYFSVICR